MSTSLDLASSRSRKTRLHSPSSLSLDITIVRSLFPRLSAFDLDYSLLAPRSSLEPRLILGSKLAAITHRFSSKVALVNWEDFKTFVINCAFVLFHACSSDAKATLRRFFSFTLSQSSLCFSLPSNFVASSPWPAALRLCSFGDHFETSWKRSTWLWRERLRSAISIEAIVLATWSIEIMLQVLNKNLVATSSTHDSRLRYWKRIC